MGECSGRRGREDGVRQWEEANVFISWCCGTLHLPLRLLVMDRVTGSAVRGISIRRRRGNIYIRKKYKVNKNKRQGIGKNRGKKEKGTLVSVNRGMCRGEKVERVEGENTQRRKERQKLTRDELILVVENTDCLWVLFVYICGVILKYMWICVFIVCLCVLV